MNELKNIPVTTVPSLNQNDLAEQMMETFNNDLPNTTDNALLYHYYIYGSIENRKYK